MSLWDAPAKLDYMVQSTTTWCGRGPPQALPRPQLRFVWCQDRISPSRHPVVPCLFILAWTDGRVSSCKCAGDASGKLSDFITTNIALRHNFSTHSLHYNIYSKWWCNKDLTCRSSLLPPPPTTTSVWLASWSSLSSRFSYSFHWYNNLFR
jgi:hypothetical protein